MRGGVTRKPLNGLDLGAIRALVEAVEADHRLATARFRVTTRWAGKTRSETTVSGLDIGGRQISRRHRILADEPCELLGSDSAANPQELFMAALNACITVGYVAAASLRGIQLDAVEIDTRAELDLRGFLGLSASVPPGHQAIDYDVRISGDGTPEQFEEIHQTVMRTSPNYFNFSRPIRMTGRLTVA